MSTVPEIERAIRQLSAEDKRRLMFAIASDLRAESGPLPPPRQFTVEEMTGWMDEDEQAMREVRAKRESRAAAKS